MVTGFGTELRYAVRGLRRNPGFSLVAILSLALGIGANMAMFGVVKTLLHTPLPVDAPGELSLVTWNREGDLGISQYGSTSYTDPVTGTRLRSNLSYPLYRALRDGAPAGTQIFAFSFLRGVSVAVGDLPAFLAGGALADGAYFSGLRVRMALGRPITDADDVDGAPLVAVLSHSFWMRAFGGDTEIVGKTVRVNGAATEVIGVTAAGFKGLSLGGFFPQTEITVPLASQPHVYARMASDRSLFTTGENFWLRVMVRVNDGVSMASVEQSLGAVLRNSPSPLLTADGYVPHLRLLPGDRGAQPVRSTTARLLYLLLGVVGVVLIISCVNLASLTLARGVARQREIAVRRALGVDRMRLIRQLLLEGLVLSVTGAALGLLLTMAGRGFLRDLLTGSLGSGAFGDVDMNLALDPVVLSVGVGLIVVATMAFGLLPAVRLSGLEPNAWLKPGGAGGNSPRLTLGRVLIALQISLSVPLLVGAALLLNTMRNLGEVELGFDPRGIAVFQVDPGFTDLSSEEYGDLYVELLARLAEVPGVRSVTVMENALLSGIISNSGITVDGEEHMLYRNAVGPGFLETMGVELLAGRVPGLQDNANAPRVGAVNRTAVRELFGGESPVGRTLHVGSRDVRVVGVVGDMPYRDLREPVPATLYESALQRTGFGGHHVVIRTNAAAARIESAVREVVYRIHPDLPVPELQTQASIIAEASAKERVFTQLLSLFGLFALLLASIGLYGVTSYSVTRRTSEIGVRVAVGARSRQILWLILRQVGVLAGLGLLMGVPLSLALGPLVGSLLFGVAPSDPLTVAVAALTMASVALAAGFVPALRASRLDALSALRTE